MNKNCSLRNSEKFFVRILIAAVFTLTAVSAFASPQGTFERTLQVNGPVNLEVLTHSGDVVVRSGSAGSVFIRGKIYVGGSWLFGGTLSHTDVSQIQQNPPIRQDGNNIHIDYVNAHNISVSYEITVPADTSLRSRTGSGNVTVDGLHGNGDAESGSGDLRLTDVIGDLRLQTGSGNVRASGISGAIHGGSGSGDIEIEETGKGDVDLHAGSGNIEVRGVNGGLRAETGSGDITVEGTQTASWEIRAGSGNVKVRLPQNAAFDADINTSSGSIDTEVPIEMTVQGRVQSPHKSLHGKVHGGGPTLSIHTGSGDIHLG